MHQISLRRLLRAQRGCICIIAARRTGYSQVRSCMRSCAGFEQKFSPRSRRDVFRDEAPMKH